MPRSRIDDLLQVKNTFIAERIGADSPGFAVDEEVSEVFESMLMFIEGIVNDFYPERTAEFKTEVYNRCLDVLFNSDSNPQSCNHFYKTVLTAALVTLYPDFKLYCFEHAKTSYNEAIYNFYQSITSVTESLSGMVGMDFELQEPRMPAQQVSEDLGAKLTELANTIRSKGSVTNKTFVDVLGFATEAEPTFGHQEIDTKLMDIARSVDSMTMAGGRALKILDNLKLFSSYYSKPAVLAAFSAELVDRLSASLDGSYYDLAITKVMTHLIAILTELQSPDSIAIDTDTVVSLYPIAKKNIIEESLMVHQFVDPVINSPVGKGTNESIAAALAGLSKISNETVFTLQLNLPGTDDIVSRVIDVLTKNSEYTLAGFIADGDWNFAVVELTNPSSTNNNVQSLAQAILNNSHSNKEILESCKRVMSSFRPAAADLINTVGHKNVQRKEMVSQQEYKARIEEDTRSILNYWVGSNLGYFVDFADATMTDIIIRVSSMGVDQIAIGMAVDLPDMLEKKFTSIKTSDEDAAMELANFYLKLTEPMISLGGLMAELKDKGAQESAMNTYIQKSIDTLNEAKFRLKLMEV